MCTKAVFPEDMVEDIESAAPPAEQEARKMEESAAELGGHEDIGLFK